MINNNNNKKFENKYNFDLTEELLTKTKTNEGDLKEENQNISEKNNCTFEHVCSQITNKSLNSINNNYDTRPNKYDDEKNIYETQKAYNFNIQLTNEIEIKKTKEENKNYYFNLKRKILLNHKLLVIFLDNFYRDEFNYSRKTSYLIFIMPLCVLAFFKVVSPYHPFLGLSLGMSMSGSLISFAYYLRKETNHLGHLEHSSVGRRIRDIKNEISLISPLAKPILENDLIKENKNI